jgi:ATP-dependent helicase HrpB
LTLPVEAVLPALLAALRSAPNCVLVAPPGAGKTTAVAPALLDEPWCTGAVLLLSPRRLAARAAAERMAELAGEPVGRRIGYATRLDSRYGPDTRILVLTEGIFRNRIQADPELAGVSAVLFDEVHERSLGSDFGLALALDAQQGLRPELRLLAMSATLDGARFAALMGARVIESAGRSWPLALRHLGRRPDSRIEDEMAAAIRLALAQEEGDILAFLPGVAEIERTAERLAGIPAAVHRLHGSLDPAAQRAAIVKGAGRKVILATAIAETSLTIDGIRIVIDSGLARRARHDRVAGVSRLVTERASQAAVTQRAGRAARQGPGIAYRLWEEAATAGLPEFDPPEIGEADLSPLLLDCAIWGVSDPATLRWLDPPSPAALAGARARLLALGAIDADGRPTAHGRAISRLPLPPRLAHMLLRAPDVRLAAAIALLLTERGLGGADPDLETRLARWRGDLGKRAKAARAFARRLAALAAPGHVADGDPAAAGHAIAATLALAFPDWVCRRRDAAGERWLSAGGREFRLDPSHPLARSEWLAVGDIQGVASGARILAAADLPAGDLDALFADRISQTTSVQFDVETGGVRTLSGRMLGAIALTRAANAPASAEEIGAALVAGVREHGLGIIRWPDAAVALRSRARWAGLDLLEDDRLIAALDEWLPAVVAGHRRLGDVPHGSWCDALRQRLGWDGQQVVDRLAPAAFTTPAGSTHPIDYAAEAGPTVTLRAQALFGLCAHPVIGPQRTPLILSLTSPAGRPIQTTRDLPGFWAGSWAEVAREMRGRYPRHNWPDDPASATASLKTKKALDRSR